MPKKDSVSPVGPRAAQPDLSYVRPLYYISLVTALAVPISTREYEVTRSAGYRAYCLAVMAAVAVCTALSFVGRIRTTYRLMIETVSIIDIMQQVVLLVANLFSLWNVFCHGPELLRRYFLLLKKVDEHLAPIVDLRAKQRRFHACLAAVHVATALLCAYDYWTWSTAMSFEIWANYGFRLYTYYMCLVVVMQICTFAVALRCRFMLLNVRLTALSGCWHGAHACQPLDLKELFLAMDVPAERHAHSDIDVRCIIRMHDMLCDAVLLVNRAFGFNVVLLVCIIVINCVMAFNLMLIFGVGVIKTTSDTSPAHIVALNIIWAVFFVALGVAVSRFCSAASAEAWRTATLCFKFLNYFRSESALAHERELRLDLLRLVRQVEHRRPSFDAAGFFAVDNTMLYAVIGAITSYIVIVIQFNNSFGR